MGAVVAVLQSDPNLLRCQLHRLRKHVTLELPDGPPDAYGFGYYSESAVLLSKRPTGAAAPLGLPELAASVESEALLVHARRATVGKAKDENTHPFRFRRWLFAHDGTVARWDEVKPRLVAALPDFLRRNVMGDTDSEHAFMLFLALLREGGSLDDLDLDPQVAGRALGRTVRQIDAWTRAAGATEPSRLDLVATNGRVLVATRRGGTLFYALLEGIVPCEPDAIDLSTPESDPRVRPHRRVKAVCFASRLLAPNGFVEVPDGSVVAVSRNLQVSVAPISGTP